MANDPILDGTRTPTKEDLEDYLGPGRFRRFDSVYNEMINMGFDAQLTWSKNDKSWFYRFYYKGDSHLFDIYWGHDFFYTLIILSPEDYLELTRHADITPDALTLIRKFPENQVRKTVRVEANMEKMNEQEGFFDLLPLLIKVVL